MQVSSVLLVVLLLVLSLGQPAQRPQDAVPPCQEGSSTVRLAVIGDYGDGSQAAADVADLVKSWQPDLILTTGDNNYPSGSADTIDGNVGRFYSDFIAPYQGAYGPGSEINRFFPSLGNHDWRTRSGDPALPTPYLEYFTLPEGPGQERYYDLAAGPVHIFVLDSDYREPDGRSSDSVQAAWLREGLATARTPWKLVVMHEPPYSSGWHGSSEPMRWPYQEWGATAVLAGHDHTYERVLVDGFPYFVNGLGGSSRYWFVVPVAGSQIRYSADSGAMLIEVNPEAITFQFITRAGELVDTFRIPADAGLGNPVPSTGQEKAGPRLRQDEPMFRPSQRRAIGT